ncbi:MAG: LytTR family DNA-binding domain-containing protein, partial [Bacteroidota bacterium]
QSLKHLQPIFEPYGFVRVHRSYMVNLASIQLIHDEEIFIGEHRIPVGRSHKAALMAAIQVV